MTPRVERGGGFGKKLSTLAQLVRTGNLKDFRRAVRHNLRLLRRYVELDGCRFALQSLDSDSEMWIALISGSYEQPERRALARHLDPDLPVIELGGCAGVIACLTNRRLRDRRAHVVVEANPHMVAVLRKNAKLNGCDFQIVNAAIAYGDTCSTFSPSSDAWVTRIDSADGAQVTVPNTTLRSLTEANGFGAFTLICDIEGHEYELVKNEPEAVGTARTLILETHERFIGKEKNDFVLSALANLGFAVVDQIENVVVLTRQSRAQSRAQ
jgi:FkbM family methyltransferase